MRKLAFAALASCAIAAPAMAQSGVSLSSAVYVEHIGHTGDGRVERMVEPATRLVSGETVVLMVKWRARPDGRGFEVTSPIPATLAFTGSSHSGEQISTDGGRHWGTFGALTVHDGYGVRLASPADITDVRWPISAREAAQGSGLITYSAVVR